MTDDLDPTTQRIVSELAANILPALTKSLASAIPATDLSGILERSNRTSQDLRTNIEKAIRLGIDEERAGRSVILQSIGGVLEETAALRKSIDKLPALIDAALKAKPDSTAGNTNPRELTEKLDAISSRLEEVIHGIKSFGEAYAQQIENSALQTEHQPIYSGSEAILEKLVSASLPGLENLVRANAKYQMQELEALSQEISAMHEQNNIALVHELKQEVADEISRYGDEMSDKFNGEHNGKFNSMIKMFRLSLIMSGASLFLMIIVVIMTLLK